MNAAGSGQMADMAQQLAELRQMMQQLWQERGTTEAVARPQPTPQVVADPPIPLPETFDGDRAKFKDFKSACILYFRLMPRTYTTERNRVWVIISLLRGDPRSWANALEETNPALLSVGNFFTRLGSMYDDPNHQATAEIKLDLLRQGSRPAEDYAAQFRAWAPATRWNESALYFQFRKGLNDPVKDELARCDPPETLEGLINRAIGVDRRIRERQRERSQRTPFSRPNPRRTSPKRTPTPPPAKDNPPEEPMEVDRSRGPISEAERRRRRKAGLCMYCGEATHKLVNCPHRPRGECVTPPAVHIRTSSPGRHILISLSLQWDVKTITINALIDSGATSSLMDIAWATEHQIPCQARVPPIPLQMVDGSTPKSGPISSETQELTCVYMNSVFETRQFFLTLIPGFPVILGFDWLKKHNPRIDWSKGEVCFRIPPEPIRNSEIQCTPGQIPEPYHDLLEVFDEVEADILPPHRPYDCPIELFPGAAPPVGHVYPLSGTEVTTLREYLDDNLKKGFIRHSKSPMGAGMFFVKKKDGGLRPVVDYRALNKITIKNSYPLPLIPQLMERLQGARWFTKLDLRGAYNLIRIREGDEYKTAFRTRYGLFEYLVMPFGLCNAPATFQSFVNDVFRDLLDICVVVYLDDILIFSQTLPEHIKQVRAVLGRLKTHKLFAKQSKCEFHRQTISFLGYVISAGSVQMDQEKVTAVAEWPVPKTRHQLQVFLGFANYYRKFIAGFSKIVNPLTSLTSIKVKFQWTAEAQAAFETLKKRFTTAPILHLPDASLPYTLEVMPLTRPSGQYSPNERSWLNLFIPSHSSLGSCYPRRETIPWAKRNSSQ